MSLEKGLELAVRKFVRDSIIKQMSPEVYEATRRQLLESSTESRQPGQEVNETTRCKEQTSLLKNAAVVFTAEQGMERKHTVNLWLTNTEKQCLEKLALFYDTNQQATIRKLIVREASKVADSISFLESSLERFLSEERILEPYRELLQRVFSLSEEGLSRNKIPALEGALEKLSDNYPAGYQVIKLRFGLEDSQRHTLQSIGSVSGITRERVRQIEAKALEKLRKWMES